MASKTILPSKSSQISQFSDGGTNPTVWIDASFQPYYMVNAFAYGTPPAAPFRMYSLQTSGYGFNIPTGATIDGISVFIFGNSVGRTFQGTVNLPSATAKSFTIPDAAPLQPFTLGGPTDTWGKSWTVSDINSPSFGMILKNSADNTTTAAYQFDIRYFEITVYYTPVPNPYAGPFIRVWDGTSWVYKKSKIRTSTRFVERKTKAY